MRRWAVAVALLMGACGPLEEGASREDAAADQEVAQIETDLGMRPPATELRVMTQNLYTGADVAPILLAPPDQLPYLVAQAFHQIQATDFPIRAEELAVEIMAAAPHLIGLQEAELIRVQAPGDQLGDNPTPATTVAYDYLQLLLDALQSLGACYYAAAITEETDIELPAIDPGLPPYDVRLTDRDVVLARCDVATSNPETRNFVARLVVPVGGLGSGVFAEIVRGWAAVDAQIGQRTFHFVDTHLEPATLPEIAVIQVAQAKELLLSLSTEKLPVVLVGDFNSAADLSTTPTYALVRAAGYADAWTIANDGAPGYTCCQAANLRNPISQLSQRIDYVFLRDFSDLGLDWTNGAVSAYLVGDGETIPDDFPLWPSDHAGVVAKLRIGKKTPLLTRIEELAPKAPEGISLEPK